MSASENPYQPPVIDENDHVRVAVPVSIVHELIGIPISGFVVSSLLMCLGVAVTAVFGSHRKWESRAQGLEFFGLEMLTASIGAVGVLIVYVVVNRPHHPYQDRKFAIVFLFSAFAALFVTKVAETEAYFGGICVAMLWFGIAICVRWGVEQLAGFGVE